MSEGPHLLVVDDKREVRDALRPYLVKHGLCVSTAESAAAARRARRQGAIDRVVLDVMMPREDGLSLCRELRAEGGGMAGLRATLQLPAGGDTAIRPAPRDI